MPKRTTRSELENVLGRKGYGIASSLGPRSIASTIGSVGKVRDLEPGGGYESLRAQAVALDYSGKCEVRIKFFRKRLADYSRANCEKYIIDSLTYAGLIRDDSEKEILLVDEGQIKVDTDAEERVEINLIYPSVNFDTVWVKREKLGNIGK
jgi:hypothetical protein